MTVGIDTGDRQQELPVRIARHDWRLGPSHGPATRDWQTVMTAGTDSGDPQAGLRCRTFVWG